MMGRPGACGSPYRYTGRIAVQQHPLLTNTTLTSEDLAALRRIWERQHPHEIALLIGSREWVDQQQRIAEREKRKYAPIKALKQAYRELNEKTIQRINAKHDSFIGKQLDVTFINHLELLIAVHHLPPLERDCWLFHTYDSMNYEDVATTMDTTVEAVYQLIHRAGEKLIEAVFEPLIVEIHL
jgi:DNA-directed RNA polymerase specialized sigma24 family protein